MGFFVLSPSPLLFLLPLMGLLAWSRPAGTREWAWLAGSAALCALWLVAAGGLTDQLANASAVLVTGAFLCLVAARPGPLFSRSVWAGLVGLAALALWCLALGISWNAIEVALTRDWWAVARLLASRASRAEAPQETLQLIDRLAEAGRPLARLFPGRLFLSGVLGLVLATVWQHRITGRASGLHWDRFRDFRLSDHLVWVVIVSIAVLLVPSPAPGAEPGSPVGDTVLAGLAFWTPVAANLLEVCVALYATRGAAVMSTVLRVRMALILLAIGIIFLLPFLVIGLASLGLADTWVDFRRRVAEARASRPGG